MTTWASTSNFNDRYDARLIAQLSNDTNSTAPNYTTIQTLLDDAASDIRLAVLQGSIYTVAQLDALVVSGDTQLIRLNCDVAISLIGQRRGGQLPQGMQKIADRADATLDALRTGKNVLNIVSNRVADTPAMVNLTGEQLYNLGDITINEFWSDRYGTDTTNGQTV